MDMKASAYWTNISLRFQKEIYKVYASFTVYRGVVDLTVYSHKNIYVERTK